MVIEIQRIFKSGWRGFRRQGNLTFATCLILIITVSLISVLFVSRKLLNFAITEIKAKTDISVYFKADSLEEDIFKVKEKLDNFKGVQEVEYVSSGQALEDFIKRHKDEKDLMDSLVEVGANPFLASLNIKAQNTEGYEKIAGFLVGEEFNNVIEKVDYHKRKSVIEKVFTVTSFLDAAGILVSLVLISVSLLITFNTIRLAICTQEKEIGIMRLVGASNWFIRAPYLVQGVLCATVSFAIVFLLVNLSFSFINTKLLDLFPGFQLLSFYKTDLGSIIFIQLIFSLILGIVPSLVAIRKYLEV